MHPRIVIRTSAVKRGRMWLITKQLRGIMHHLQACTANSHTHRQVKAGQCGSPSQPVYSRKENSMASSRMRTLWLAS
jgi:hypothetical protein